MPYFLARLHTTAKAVSEAEYSSYGATKQGAQVTQVCFLVTVKIYTMCTYYTAVHCTPDPEGFVCA